MSQNRLSFAKVTASIITCLSLFALSSQTQALPLNLDLQSSPDIHSDYSDVTYDANSTTLTMSGYTLDFFDGSNKHDILGTSDFILSAMIDNSGQFISGSVFFGGTVTALGFNSDTLLTGTLTSFGFGNSDILEFTFDATGGDALSLFTGTGGIIASNTDFAGDWNNNWNNNFGVQGWGLGRADAGVIVSAPPVILLISISLGLFGITRRFKSAA